MVDILVLTCIPVCYIGAVTIGLIIEAAVIALLFLVIHCSYNSSHNRLRPVAIEGALGAFAPPRLPLGPLYLVQ